ncbi:MAG: alkaline phosphatase, partial [Fischerella sp.]|nr:alkaline phosphatase [Fischerella sp.]
LDNTEIYALMYETLFGVAPEAAAAQQETELISGTPGDDFLFTGAPDSQFDGVNDIVFLGSGNDEVDLQLATSPIAGNNRIDLGSGDDVIFLNKNDRVFGGSGNDQFYAQSGGDNQISGGEGQDQFWIVSNQLPETANTILDFEIGRDVIGILGSTGLGINADSLGLNTVNGNTEITFGDQTLAILNGVTGVDINTSFVFA